MPYFLLIENKDEYDRFTRQDMTRWWRGCCKHHATDNELLVETTGRLNLWGGVERLRSFGIRSRVVRRPVDIWGRPQPLAAEHS